MRYKNTEKVGMSDVDLDEDDSKDEDDSDNRKLLNDASRDSMILTINDLIRRLDHLEHNCQKAWYKANRKKRKKKLKKEKKKIRYRVEITDYNGYQGYISDDPKTYIANEDQARKFSSCDLGQSFWDSLLDSLDHWEIRSFTVERV
jgi:hypothetical protein